MNHQTGDSQMKSNFINLNFIRIGYNREFYTHPDGWTMRREMTENQYQEWPIYWHLRSPYGELLGISQYRHDLSEKHGFRSI